MQLSVIKIKTVHVHVHVDSHAHAPIATCKYFSIFYNLNFDPHAFDFHVVHVL